MEILTKRPLSTKQFSLNSTLGLFTSLQCIQNTLLVAASSQTHNMADLVPVQRGRKQKKGCIFESNQLIRKCVYIWGGKKSDQAVRKGSFKLHSPMYTSASGLSGMKSVWDPRGGVLGSLGPSTPRGQTVCVAYQRFQVENKRQKVRNRAPILLLIMTHWY